MGQPQYLEILPNVETTDAVIEHTYMETKNTITSEDQDISPYAQSINLHAAGKIPRSIQLLYTINPNPVLHVHKAALGRIM